MLRQKTLLVLGAGSSWDFHFPLGPELTDRIAEAVTFDLTNFKPTGGHRIIRMRLEHMLFHQQQLYNRWIAACEYIQRNIHLSSSVDRFIESNRDDPDVVTICKLTIALIIADCEKASPFGEISDHDLSRFNFGQIKGTWTTKFFHYLHGGVSRQELDSLFEKLRVVTFNYDRVFERSLAVAIANFYRMPLAEAQSAASSVGLVHVYGSLGTLVERTPIFQPFGVFGNNPEQACSSIRTFHESASSEVAAEVGEFMGWADRVFVLGFSYADMNTDFLARCAPNLKGVKPVFGTCLGMSEQNIAVARQRMDGIFAQQNASTRLLNVNCPQFFDDLALTV